MPVTPVSTMLVGSGRIGAAEVNSISTAVSLTPWFARSDIGSPQKMRVRLGWGGVPANGEDGSGTGSVSEAAEADGGDESDRDGVAIGWRNIGEPVMRYCGPEEKLVSWPC